MYALKASAKEIPENRANYSMEAKTMEKNAYAHIGWPGQEIERFEIPWDGEIPEFDSVCLKGPAVDNDKNRYLKSVRGEAPGDVTEVAVSDGRLRVSVIPVTARADFVLSIGSLQFARDEFTIHTRTADDRFERLEEGRVLYRLYSPDAKGPRPLILFLHGGGNGGYEGERDNNKHIVADYGPVNFAENYPDLYVMAPMAVEARRDMSTFNPERFNECPRFRLVPGIPGTGLRYHPADDRRGQSGCEARVCYGDVHGRRRNNTRHVGRVRPVRRLPACVPEHVA